MGLAAKGQSGSRVGLLLSLLVGTIMLVAPDPFLSFLSDPPWLTVYQYFDPVTWTLPDGTTAHEPGSLRPVGWRLPLLSRIGFALLGGLVCYGLWAIVREVVGRRQDASRRRSGPPSL